MVQIGSEKTGNSNCRRGKFYSSLIRSEFLGAEAYERTKSRRGYRNGFKGKRIRTRVGELFPGARIAPGGPGGPFWTSLGSQYPAAAHGCWYRIFRISLSLAI